MTNQRTAPALMEKIMLTDKERKELKRLDRKVMNGKATRAEVLRAIDLKRKKVAA